jgi:hypothetical protein
MTDAIDDPIESAVNDYLKNDDYFQKTMRTFGFHDASFTQRKAWTMVIKTYTLDFILKKLPKNDEVGITAGEVRKRMGGNYDKSNLSKYLVTLVKLGFSEAATDENERPIYKRTWVGDYFVTHAGYVYMPRTEYQDALTKAEQLLVERDVKISELEDEIARARAEIANLTAENVHLKSKSKEVK